MGNKFASGLLTAKIEERAACSLQARSLRRNMRNEFVSGMLTEIHEERGVVAVSQSWSDDALGALGELASVDDDDFMLLDGLAKTGDGVVVDATHRSSVRGDGCHFGVHEVQQKRMRGLASGSKMPA